VTGGRSHSDARAGCTVRSTTASSGREHFQVDLLAQPGHEPLHTAGGVIAAPVEAPIHKILDTAAQRLERGRGGQGGRGHGQAAGVAGQAGDRGKDEQVGQDQQAGDQHPGESAADQPVQVPQPVAQHRHRHRHRHRRAQQRRVEDERGGLGKQPHAPGRVNSSPTTAPAAPAATQRIC